MVLLLTFVVVLLFRKAGGRGVQGGESRTGNGWSLLILLLPVSAILNNNVSCFQKVMRFRNLPSSCFTDGEFVNLVKDHGAAVRYLLAPDRREVRR